MNHTSSLAQPLRAAVFASGSGSNFQALVDGARAGGGGHPFQVRLLVTDREGIGALDRAQGAGIDAAVIPVSRRPVDEVGEETLAALSRARIDVVFLAGYLRLIPPAVVRAYPGRMLNIHPALLPGFGGKGMWGLNVHRAVLESGVRITGPTVHFVSEIYDEGTILAQWPVPVHGGDTPEALAARVLSVEHRLYPAAAAHLCRAVQQGRGVEPMDAPGSAFRSAEVPDL